LFKASEAIPYD